MNSTDAVPTIDRLRLEIWPVARLIPSARNARTHSDAQIAEIAGSIKAFGFSNPILVGAEGDIIAGHGRLAAARQLGLSEVPVVVLSGLTDLQRRQLMLADNRIALNAGWDLEMLHLELTDLSVLGADLSGLGFYGRRACQGTESRQALPALPMRMRSRNYLKRPSPQSEISGAQALIGLPVVTVPTPLRSPRCWVAWHPNSWSPTRPMGSITTRLGVIAWASTIPLDGAKSVTTTRPTGEPPGPCSPATSLMSGTAPCTPRRSRKVSRTMASRIRAQIIWAKDRLVMGRGDYHWQHEPCWYAVRTKGHWTGDRKQTTLWNIASGGQDAETPHSTQKPVECMRRPMQNNSNPGQAVYDPFLGSGTTLIAAETTGRVCLGMELEPRYVDVAVRRWQAFTGKTACLLGDGRSFEVIAAERLAGLQATNLSPAPAQPVESAVKNDPAAA